MSKETRTNLEKEIMEYNAMINHAIMTNDKENLYMWRRALQTAKVCKRRLANE